MGGWFGAVVWVVWLGRVGWAWASGLCARVLASVGRGALVACGALPPPSGRPPWVVVGGVSPPPLFAVGRRWVGGARAQLVAILAQGYHCVPTPEGSIDQVQR